MFCIIYYRDNIYDISLFGKFLPSHSQSNKPNLHVYNLFGVIWCRFEWEQAISMCFHTFDRDEYSKPIGCACCDRTRQPYRKPFGGGEGFVTEEDGTSFRTAALRDCRKAGQSAILCPSTWLLKHLKPLFRLPSTSIAFGSLVAGGGADWTVGWTGRTWGVEVWGIGVWGEMVLTWDGRTVWDDDCWLCVHIAASMSPRYISLRSKMSWASSTVL